MDYEMTERRKLEAFRLWCYRRMLEISWADDVTNTDVLRKIGKDRERPSLLCSIKKESTWMGHIRTHGRLAHISFWMFLVGGKFYRRRLGLDYTDGEIKLKKKQLMEAAKNKTLKRLFEERNTWRTAVKQPLKQKTTFVTNNLLVSSLTIINHSIG